MGKKQGKQPAAGLRILQMTPGRDERRLKLIWKGHVELCSSGTLADLAELAKWGWMVRHEPVHPLDVYYGYRPTKEGLKYLIHDEKYHLILIKKKYVEAVNARVLDAANIMLEHAMASFGAEVSAARARGWEPPSDDEVPTEGLVAAIARYERRGYMTLDRFKALHKLGHEYLIVSGVLRYIEKRDPTKLSDIDVGWKARHCLLCSTRWQTFFVQPRMQQALLELCRVEVHFIT